MAKFRKDRVAELIRHVISDLVVLKIKDPRVEGVTITEVRMSADLKTARVYFCSLADGRAQLHQQGLESAAGFIRRELRQQLDLKYVPELSFFYDSSFDYSARINELLKRISPPESD